MTPLPKKNCTHKTTKKSSTKALVKVWAAQHSAGAFNGRFFSLEFLAAQGPLFKKGRTSIERWRSATLSSVSFERTSPTLSLSPSPSPVLSSGNSAVLASASVCLPGFCELDAQQRRHATGGGARIAGLYNVGWQHTVPAPWSPRLGI